MRCSHAAREGRVPEQGHSDSRARHQRDPAEIRESPAKSEIGVELDGAVFREEQGLS